MRHELRRIELAILAVLLVMLAGTVGYVALGFSALDAIYQTVTTITTVGFREVRPLDNTGQVFTIILILVGVGTVLYTFGVVLEALVEGHLRETMRKRRMERNIATMEAHVIICGWGRVGRSVAEHVVALGRDVVVVDRDPDRVAQVPFPTYVGDVTQDDVLRRVGIGHAHCLVAAINTDAENVFVTLSARALRPDLVIVARARNEESEAKLLRAGATRVVNPQRIGGQRIAAAATQPHVVEFLDVVMHDATLEFRLEEVTVAARSPVAGRTIGETDVRAATGALLLALRMPDGQFMTDPPAGTRIDPQCILIALGTEEQLDRLEALATAA